MSEIEKKSAVDNSRIIKLLLGPLVCLVLLALPVPAGLEPMAMRAIAGAAWMIVWWAFQPFDLAITALWSVVIFPILGVITPAEAFAKLGNTTVMLFLGATILLGTWSESGLIERYAYGALNIKFLRGNPFRLATTFGLICGLMTTVVPNVPCSILFTAIAVAIAKAAQLKPGESNLARSLVVMSGVGSSVGGSGTPIGGTPNLLIIGIVLTTLNYNVEFWQWTAIGMPLALIMIALMIFFARIFFPLKEDKEKLTNASEFISEKLNSLGKISFYEIVALIALLLALFLWIFASPITKAIPELAPLGKFLSTPYIPLIIGCILFVIPIKREGPTFAMDWDLAMRSINWNAIMFIIGALNFGVALTSTGVDKWVAGLIGNLLGDISGLWVLLFLIVIGGLLTQVITNIAIVSVLVPIAAQVASLYGLNPVIAAIAVGILSNNGILFPFSSVCVAASIMGGEGYAQPKDYVLYGLCVILVGSLAAFLLALTLGPVIFGNI